MDEQLVQETQDLKRENADLIKLTQNLDRENADLIENLEQLETTKRELEEKIDKEKSARRADAIAANNVAKYYNEMAIQERVESDSLRRELETTRNQIERVKKDLERNMRTMRARNRWRILQNAEMRNSIENLRAQFKNYANFSQYLLKISKDDKNKKVNQIIAEADLKLNNAENEFGRKLGRLNQFNEELNAELERRNTYAEKLQTHIDKLESKPQDGQLEIVDPITFFNEIKEGEHDKKDKKIKQLNKQLGQWSAKFKRMKGNLLKLGDMKDNKEKEVQALVRRINNMEKRNAASRRKSRENLISKFQKQKNELIQHNLKGTMSQMRARNRWESAAYRGLSRSRGELTTDMRKSMTEMQKSIANLTGNLGKVFFASYFNKFDEEYLSKMDDVTKKTSRERFIFDNNDNEEKTWNFSGDEEIYKNDKFNHTLVGILELKNILDGFNLFKSKNNYKYDTYHALFRIYLYNKLVRKVNKILEPIIDEFQDSLKDFKFETITIFPDGQRSAQNQGTKTIDQIDLSRVEKRKIDLETLPSLNQLQTAMKNRKTTYEKMREDFIEKQFCPVFNSSKYIEKTRGAIRTFIERFVKRTKNADDTDGADSAPEIKKEIMDLLELTKTEESWKNCIVVELISKEEKEEQDKPANAASGGAKVTESQRGGNGVSLKLSKGTIRRGQNILYYNIVKTIRWKYYAHRKEMKEAIELTMFKDYLSTLIVCTFLLASGQDKIAYGMFVDQIFSVGMLYEFQDLTAILLPYYLPFT